MTNKIFTAQKGLVFNKDKVLVQKYLDAKFNPEKMKGKYGIPGGKMDFGEIPEETLVREIEEETGITIKPIMPFYTWTWIYKKGEDNVQIVATAWVAIYKSGKIIDPPKENETKLEKAKWIKFKDIKTEDFIDDEQPIIQKFLEYRKKNPFKLF